MKTWCTISTLLIVLVCGLNLNHAVRRTPPPSVPTTQPTNNVMRQEARFAPLRQALQRHAVRGTLGYLTDLSPDQLAADPKGMEDYFLTQFALVPWVLDARKADGLWAVANLHTTRPEARIPAGFRVAEDFGDGVFLLRRGPP